MKPIETHVTSLKVCPTAFGTRIYAVFQTSDGQELGIWAPDNDRLMNQIQVGDRTVLYQDSQGHFHTTTKRKGFLSQLRHLLSD